MTALWDATEARAATGGRNTSDWRAGGVSIDSRSIARDDLFVAIRGPSFDGHDYVGRAFDRGAAAGLVSHTPDGLPDRAPLLIVDDTLDALGAQARTARRRTKARVAAITGSVGKTGTKEALRRVLAEQGETTASESSLNNHWGVPLSLSRMPADTRFGVFEIGMNHAGEISPLSAMVRPDVAVITTVEMAHTEFFDSVEDVADAKAEIFDGVTHGGAAILNRDNPHFERLARHASERGITDIVSFGRHDAAEIRLLDCALEARASRVSAAIHGATIDYRIGLPGRHWVINSLAVLAAVRALGADVERAAAALAGLEPLAGRGRIHEVDFGAGELTIIDESYNANPASMRAAIETLGGMTPTGDGRRIAVLGAMRELGAASESLHAEIADPLRENHIDLLHAVGEMRAAHDRLPETMQGMVADSGEEFAAEITATLRAGDIVMVKGSNASRMAVVVETLLGDQTRREGC